MSESTVNTPELQLDPEAERRVRGSANWFYWIAGMSLVNAVSQAFFGGGFSMIIGLGATQVATAFAAGLGEAQADGTTPMVAGLAVNALISAVLAVFGYLAGRKKLWAFLVGMGIYALDGLIFVWVQDWISVGFHAFVLVMIGGGVQTLLSQRKR